MIHSEEKERIERAYRLHLKAAGGLSDASIDVASAAIHRFEESNAFRGVKKFHFRNERTGNPISKAPVLQILNTLRACCMWLAEKPGVRMSIVFLCDDGC
jgi:hypothetical protein